MNNTLDLQKYVARAMNYSTYKALLVDLFEQGKTTGPEQTEDRLTHSKLNMARINRIETTIQLNTDLVHAIKAIQKPLVILAITEGWCGDSAQNVPLFSKFDGINTNVKTKYVLRDENLPLIDAYLTNGARAIPKVIFINENNEEVGVWGARPKACQEVMEEMKKKNATKPEKEAAIHAWYAKDKTQSLQHEITAILLAIASKE